MIASALGQVLFLCPFGRRKFISTGQSAPVLRPSSPPRGRCFCRDRHGTSEAAKTAAKPGHQAGAKPQTGSRGVPGRTPCQGQGIVRYTAPTTAHENARPTLLGPGVFVGGETAAAKAARSAQASLRRVPFGGVVCEKSWRCLPSYLYQEGVNTEGQKSGSDRWCRRSAWGLVRGRTRDNTRTPGCRG